MTSQPPSKNDGSHETISMRLRAESSCWLDTTSRRVSVTRPRAAACFTVIARMSGLPCAARTAAGVTCDFTFTVDENDGPYGTIPIRLRFETCRWLTAAGGLTLLTLVSLCELFDGSTWRPQPTHGECTSKLAVATRRRQENYNNFKARARIVVKRGDAVHRSCESGASTTETH